MAENQEQMEPKEREIPVFTVLKNNFVLKNIFLLDNPPSIPSATLSVSENIDQEPETEEILVVGRHPDCNIKLEHPSISRFHLRIHSKPSSRSLFVTDLSSVHGTWVSGQRIEPGIRIKVNEGDTLQLGASSRWYRINWVPLSRAYDIDDPFVPPLDASDTVNEETHVAVNQDGDSVSYRNNQGKSLSDNVEGLEQLFSDDDVGFSMQGKSYLSYKDEVENNVSVTVEEETEGETDQDCNSLPSRDDEEQDLSEDMEGLEWLFSDENLVLSMQKSATAPPMPKDLNRSFPEKEEEDNSYSIETCNKEIEQENSTPQGHMPLAVSHKVSQEETTEYSGMNSEKRSGLSIWSRRGKPESVMIETSQGVNMGSQVKSVLDESMLKDDHRYVSSDNDDEMFTPDKENTYPNSHIVVSLKCKFEETSKDESISNYPISSVDHDGEKITPDKENVTPDSHLLRSVKNVGRSGEVKRLNLYRPSPLKIANNENMYCVEEVLVPKTSQHPKVLQESKSKFSVSKSNGTSKKQQNVIKVREDRKPFRPLPVISISNHKADSVPSVHESTMRSCRSIKHLESEDFNQLYKNSTKVSKNRWIIVADTTCLLNRKSRNELQLLRGLRGTTLTIPRIVVRELDCMLRRASFFSRMTEASAALSWIEECMAETKWWIHVQSSAEEGRLVPPTPPAPSHWFNDDKNPFSAGSIPFSPYTLQEIVTPTPADHILECALLFRRTTNGQLVLLSDDVTLKIKAMAEGVICETAEEFRSSLVNPFSPRFLYSNSSPIGPTWSCFDDTVLKENYYPSPSKNSKSGESSNARGLKLILLHNSSFRQMTTN